MGMQRFRADEGRTQADGGVVWYTQWVGGPSVAMVKQCRAAGLSGEPRVTAYATGEPGTWSSIPAVCSYKGCRVEGYLTGDDAGSMVFQHCYY